MADPIADLMAKWNAEDATPKAAPSGPATQIADARAKRGEQDAIAMLGAKWDTEDGGGSPPLSIQAPPAIAAEARRRRERETGALPTAPGGGGVVDRALAGAKKTELGVYNYLVHSFGEDNVREVIGRHDDSPQTFNDLAAEHGESNVSYMEDPEEPGRVIGIGVRDESGAFQLHDPQAGEEIQGFRFRESKDHPWKEFDPSGISDIAGDIADVAVPFVAEAVPEIIGTGAGIAGGGAIGGPAGAAIGGKLGGAAGAAAGAYLSDYVSGRVPGEEGPRESTASQDALIGAGASLTLGSIGPLAKRAAKPGVQRLAERVAKEAVVDTSSRRAAKMTTAETLENRLRLAKETRTGLTPGQATGSRRLLQAEDAMDVGDTAADIYTKKVNQGREAGDHLGRALDAVGRKADPNDVGEGVSKIYTSAADAADKARAAASRPHFKRADELLAGRNVPIARFRATAQELIDRYSARAGTDPSRALVRGLEGMMERLGDADAVPAQELSNMLSGWGQAAKGGAIEAFKDADPKRARGAAVALFTALKKDLDDAAASIDLGAGAAEIAKGRDVFREMSKPVKDLRNKLLEGAVKLADGGQADTVGASIAQSKSPSLIRKALVIADRADPDVGAELRRDVMEAILAPARKIVGEAGDAAIPEAGVSAARFMAIVTDPRTREKINAVLSSGDAEQARAWHSTVDIMRVLADKGMPYGPATATRINNTIGGRVGTALAVAGAGAAGGALGGAVGGKEGAALGSVVGGAVGGIVGQRPRVNLKLLASLINDPDKLDDFYGRVRAASKKAGPRKNSAAWAGADALAQLGVIEWRDETTGGANAAQIEAARNPRERIAPGAELALD